MILSFRRLVAIAIAVAFIGACIVFFGSEHPLPDARAREVYDEFRASFATGGWYWLSQATMASVVVAGVLMLSDSLLGLSGSPRALHFERLSGTNVRDAIHEVSRRVAVCLAASKPNVVAAFDELIRGAISISASDVHMSPTPDGLRLTYRVHGTLHEVAKLDLAIAPALATRAKVLARIDTYVKDKPQDGRLIMTLDGSMIEARASTLPTDGGERIVLRLVRGSRSVPDIDSLGFSPEVLSRLNEVLAKPQGLFFCAAPVGSGKTTTLYASMKHIARTRGATTSLVTLEDPIELELPFATQTQMRTRGGMTFATALRSVLRQDPNVLMVGEIRDHETADIAMQAGLTGHLILTTVHGESSVGPFARLIDMSVEPFVVASASLGCLSQRLVRTLCTACRRPMDPEKIVVDRFARHSIIVPPQPYYESIGCDFCEGQGFTGRAPIAEILVINAEMREAITDRRPSNELHQIALAQGMTPLLRDGLNRAMEGETSLAEVIRVAG